MKKFIYIFSIVIIALSSCQKVIDVDLNDANTNIVIEANYTAEDSTVRVHVSTTSSFFDSNTSPDVNDAVVTIFDQSGTPTLLNFVGNGDYELTNYVPAFNSTYTMTVFQNGSTYTAECTMHSIVNLEPITYQFFPGFFGGEGGYAAFMNFYDPLDTVNHYLAIVSLNGVPYDGIGEIFTQDDKLTDGNFVERPLFGEDLFDIGDTVAMELRTVDVDIFNYYEQINSIAGGGQSSGAPGNPTSNWDNKALGYFSCYPSSRQEVIIQ